MTSSEKTIDESVVLLQRNFAVLLIATPEVGGLSIQVQPDSSVNNITSFAQTNNLFRIQESLNGTNPPAVSVLLPEEVLEFYRNFSNGLQLYSVVYEANSALYQDINVLVTGSLIFTVGQAGGPAPRNLTSPVRFTFETTQVR